MEMKYKFPKVEVDIDGKGDKVNPQLIVRNSYDGGWKFGLMLGAFRLVCSNGLVIGKTMYMLKQLHYESLDLDRVRLELGDALNKFSTQTKIWEKWVSRVVKSEEYEETMGVMDFSTKDTEQVISDINKKENLTKKNQLTMWLFYNIITAFITHQVRSQNKRVTLEDRARRAFDKYNK